ncbi:MAG: hypothetical protein LBT89_01900 [Planctomycetaceae bacterium]|nr:hypothetical protein [Planctomycetaceae bacterium]
MPIIVSHQFTPSIVMKLKQLSLFLENKPGNVRKACRTLADNGINIETMALADTEQFGILRILVKDWERAKEVFEKNGVIVRVSEVVALAVGHRPGGLADILDTLDAEGLNIEYMYGFFQQFAQTKAADIKDSAVIVFRFDDPDAAVTKLQERKIRILGSNELFQ